MTWVHKRVGSAVLELHPAEIVGKGRPRFTRSGRTYTPRKTKRAELAIRDEFLRVSGERWAKFRGPVSVHIVYGRELAKSNPKFWAGRADTGKPDLDNCGKLILDALNGIAFMDDSQVVNMTIAKSARRPWGTGNLLKIEIAYYNEIYRKEEE